MKVGLIKNNLGITLFIQKKTNGINGEINDKKFNIEYL